MKNIILTTLFLFMSISTAANATSVEEAQVMESYEVIKVSKALRAELSEARQSRALASISEEDVKWVEYWQDLMNEPTEDPTYWINRFN